VRAWTKTSFDVTKRLTCSMKKGECFVRPRTGSHLPCLAVASTSVISMPEFELTPYLGDHLEFVRPAITFRENPVSECNRDLSSGIGLREINFCQM
jgi:hypothetical protein